MITFNSLPELIEKVEKIPVEKWCVDHLKDFNGRRCIMGHISGFDFIIGQIALAKIGIDADLLVMANNGKGLTRSTDGAAVKARVLRFLRRQLTP